MNVRNCRKCGRIFNYVLGPNICPACREAMETKFQEVKKYVQENHNATIPDVSRECEVDASQIQQWIREERLQFADDSPIKVNCEKCGAMIGSGRFCDKCKLDMVRGLNGAIATNSPKEQPTAQRTDPGKNRMRFLDQ